MPTKILMPALSPTMTEGTIAKWLVAEGEDVSAGDVIAEVETDKATMEIEAVEEGKIGKLLLPEGTGAVPVNSVIAVLLEEGEDASALADFDTAAAAPTPAAPAPAAPTAPETEALAVPAAAPAAAPATNGHAGGRIFISPLARRMATQAGLDLAGLAGSGPNGRIVKRDVEAALSGAAPVVEVGDHPAVRLPGDSPFEPAYTLEPATTMRKTIARRLTESKQTVPHFYMSVDCVIDRLLEVRKELNEQAGGEYKISVNDMVIKAVALALREIPAANAAWTGDAVKLYRSADISVAVATERGLITPVVRKAERKGLRQISKEMKGLAEKAQAGKLQPAEYEGGSFSISNLGMYEIDEFSAVINPPQACILAVAAGKERAIARNGEVVVATVMRCTLSTDHRAVDGAIGADFLGAFRRLIERPLAMML